MVARVVWDHEAAGSSPVTSTIGMRLLHKEKIQVQQPLYG